MRFQFWPQLRPLLRAMLSENSDVGFARIPDIADESGEGPFSVKIGHPASNARNSACFRPLTLTADQFQVSPAPVRHFFNQLNSQSFFYHQRNSQELFGVDGRLLSKVDD